MGKTLNWNPQAAFADFFYTDQEEILSRRTVFREDVDYFVPFGGRGCVDGDTEIETPSGKIKIKDFKGGLVLSFDGSSIIEVNACRPVKYNPEPLYKVSLSNGESVTCTAKHKWLTNHGWIETSSFSNNQSLLDASFPSLQGSSLELSLSRLREDVQHSIQKLASFLYCYLMDRRRYDEQLQSEVSTYLDVFQLLADELRHNRHASTCLDGLESAHNNDHSQSLRHLSSQSSLLLKAVQDYETLGSYDEPKTSELFLELHQESQKFHENKDLDGLALKFCDFFLQNIFSSLIRQDENLSVIFDTLLRDVDGDSYSTLIGCNINPHINTIKIESIEPVGNKEFYDIFVPIYNNYIASGVIHHNSAKTYSFIDAIVVEATIRPVRILCAREYQISIEESVKAEIEAAIYARGVESFFKILRTEIDGLNGSKFIFKGIKNNIRNLKSISDVDILLCEEAEGVSKNSWDKLLPSIRPRKPFGNRGKHPINIIIFNPDDELDDTYQRFIINPPPRSVVKLINWRDNKYFPPHLNEMRLHSLKTRPLKDHEHDWEGKPKSASEDVIIDREWIRAARFASENPDFVHCGERRVSYDPAGQGKDANARIYGDGNIVRDIDEWVKSADLREASERAFSSAISNDADMFTFDTCGGLGDGVSVFIDDAIIALKEELKKELQYLSKENRKDQEVIDGINAINNRIAWTKTIKIFPFDAGALVVNPKKKIPGTKKTWGDQYSNAKAQAHAITAQKLYNTFRFIVLGERDIEPSDMMSIDIDDDVLFNKLTIELSTPIWVKSGTNSKKKVEDKKAMLKRTGLPSPNVGDGIHMLNAPQKKGNRWNG